ncbi:hypothetical protein [Bacillus cereus group sp. BfR-BA-01425]|uniref:hypothetical protein n=1 Tax=Bacillus cereus group sp. BfR-BA-01425 TaxID=2920342 RepID=UPI001F585618|nr:hypothetical protein [Bacillus cereus group sp. BfR-BA-01425]
MKLTPLGLKQQTVGDDSRQNFSEVFYKDFASKEIREFEVYLESILDNLSQYIYIHPEAGYTV